MNTPSLQRRYIWPASLRLSHWLLALSLIGLLGSGWFIGHVARFYLPALDYHYIFAYLLSIATAIRLYLFVREKRGAACLRDLLPGKNQRQAMLASLKFYVSLGRTPLPRWYAHNPLWAPLYLLLWIIVVLQIISGFLVGAGHSRLLFNLYDLHVVSAVIIFWFCLLHVLAVFVHDLKGNNSDASAMIHGYRVFVTDALDMPASTHRVSLSDISSKTDHS